MLHIIQNFTGLCECLKKEPIYKDLRIYANFDKGLEKGSGYSFPDPTYLFLNNVSNLSSFRFPLFASRRLLLSFLIFCVSDKIHI